MRTPALLVAAILLSACKQTPPAAPSVKDESKEPVHDYALHGEILRLDPKDKIAVIKHQAISDGQTVWMGAMTMEFPVKDDKEFSTLRAGEKINATVHVRGTDIPVFWVDQIHEEAGEPTPTAK